MFKLYLSVFERLLSVFNVNCMHQGSESNTISILCMHVLYMWNNYEIKYHILNIEIGNSDVCMDPMLRLNIWHAAFDSQFFSSSLCFLFIYSLIFILFI